MIALPREARYICVYQFLVNFLCHRKHNLEASGSPLSGSYSLREYWSEDERMHTIAMVLKVRPPRPQAIIDCQGIENLSKLHVHVCLNGIFFVRKRFSLMFQSLGLRGVLDLLGVRCTVGSHNILPPPKETLLESFTRPHHPSAKLSVGGRALSKHSHRDDTRQWWGICTGSMYDSNSCSKHFCNG